MPNKKFSVFISSVYKGMRETRAMVAAAVAETQCIPEGMERFSIGTQNKWKVIQRAINMSDFCIVVLGGRYGSIVPDGIVRAMDGLAHVPPGVGYTELEYHYAIKRKVPVLPLLHETPEDMLVGEAASGEKTDEKREKFRAFRDLLSDGTPGYWTSSDGLHEKVKDAVRVALLEHPNRTGWVRGSELKCCQNRVEELEKEVRKLRTESTVWPGGTSGLGGVRSSGMERKDGGVVFRPLSPDEPTFGDFRGAFPRPPKPDK